MVSSARYFKMWICTVFSLLAVLLPEGHAYDFGTCSTEEITDLINALPNSHECGAAMSIVQAPQTASDDEYRAALDTFCTVDCGKVIAKYISSSCNSLSTSSLLLISCLPMESGTDHCRSAFPDTIGGSDADFSSCSNFETHCPSSDCQSALTALVEEVGCCYETVYSDGYIIHLFVQEGLLSAEDLEVLFDLANPALWATCDVEIPSYCTGQAFLGESSLAVGVCTADQLLSAFLQPVLQVMPLHTILVLL